VNQHPSEAGMKLQCDWNLKDSDSVKELYARIARIAETENYQHEIQTLENNKVQVNVWTPSIGELSLSTKISCSQGAELFFADKSDLGTIYIPSLLYKRCWYMGVV